MKKKDIERLRHMENTIIPILVALSIISFSQILSNINFGIFIQPIFLILLIVSLMLALMHLYSLILNDIKMRVRTFLITSIILIAMGMTFILTSIQTALHYFFKFDFFSFEGLLVNGLSSIIGIIIILKILKWLLINKIMPAFREKIFKDVWKEYGFNFF